LKLAQGWIRGSFISTAIDHILELRTFDGFYKTHSMFIIAHL